MDDLISSLFKMLSYYDNCVYGKISNPELPRYISSQVLQATNNMFLIGYNKIEIHGCDKETL